MVRRHIRSIRGGILPKGVTRYAFSVDEFEMVVNVVAKHCGHVKSDAVAKAYQVFPFQGIDQVVPKLLYKTVEQYIRKHIESGEWVPGDLIPSESQLSEQLSVSIGTVRKAIDLLEQEKLLYRHQGKGTYVSRIDFNNSLFRYFSYGTGSGEPARIRKVTPKRERILATADLCKLLQVSIGTPLVYIERLGLDDDDHPVLVEKCWWLADIVAGLEDTELHIPDLFYALIEERFGVHIVRAQETLTADIADRDTAKMLEINSGDPIVVLLRTTHTVNDRIIEYRVTRGRLDKFSYKTEIR